MMANIQTWLGRNSEKLDLYTQAISNVHGRSHPEAIEVREIYQELQSKIKHEELDHLDLDELFQTLRKLTHQYQVPDDVCPTYKEVYHLLAEADKVYHD